jgi:trigger factor
MQVTVESTGSLERQIKVTVPEERIAAEVQDRLRTLGKTARVHGFRPGKAPMRVLERSYGRQVRDEVVAEVLRASFQDAVVQQALTPAGGPTIRELDAEPGRGLAYTAVFEVYPAVTLPDLSGLKVTRLTAEVTDQDVDAMVMTLRRQRRQWGPAGREAALGDRVVVDYEGRVDGEAVPGGAAQRVPVELGTHRLVEGLEERLVGARAGEEREVAVSFPADHPNAQLAGKTVVFQVKVHEVEAGRLPEVDQDFIRSFGVQEGGEEALRREVRGNMERELRDTLQARVKQEVMDALLAATSLEVPKSLVDAESERLRQQTRDDLVRGGTGASSLQLPLSIFEAQARRRVALGLVLSEVVKASGLRVDPDRVRARVESVSSTYQEPDEVVRWYYADKRRLSEVESVVMEEQVVDWVLDRASVTEHRTSFDAVMKAGQTPAPVSSEGNG